MISITRRSEPQFQYPMRMFLYCQSKTVNAFCLVSSILQVVDINEGYLSLMADGGEVRDDIKVPENDIGKEITAKFERDDQFVVTILKAMGEESAVGTKAMTK